MDNSYFRQAYNRGSTFKMPILLFLLDTSASMNQRTYLGTTYLDVAKGAVEVFMKVKNDFTRTFFSTFGELGVPSQHWSKLIYVILDFFFFDSCVPETRLVEATGTC